MKGISHLIIISCGVLGLLIGGVLIDLDHKGSLKCLWKGFWKTKHGCTEMKAGILHNPVILLSIITFSISLGFGMLIHLLADFIKYIR